MRRSASRSGRSCWAAAARSGRPTVEEIDAAADPLVLHGSFDDAVAAVTSTFGEYVDRIASWRTDETPAAALAAYVLWSATVAPEGLVDPRVGAHVDALDGQALELGPLLQRVGPGTRADRCGRRPVPRAVRPPGRHRSAARLDHPLRGALQLRQATHPRVGAARAAGPRRPPTDHRRAHRDPRPARTLDRLLARPPSRPGPPAALLPARQRQRLGQLHDVRRRPGHRVARPRGVPRAPARGARRPRPTSSGCPSQRWRDARELVIDALCVDLWNGKEFIAVGALSGRPSTASSLLNLLPLVLGDRLPADVRDALAARLEGHLTDFGPATEPSTPRTTRTTATGAARSGRPRPR